MPLHITDFRNITNNPGKYVDKRIVVSHNNEHDEILSSLGFFKRIVKYLTGNKTARKAENKQVHESFRQVLQSTYGSKHSRMTWDAVFNKTDKSQKLTDRKITQALEFADYLAKTDEKVFVEGINSLGKNGDFSEVAKHVKDDLGAAPLMKQYGLTDHEAVCIHLCASNFAQISKNPEAIYDDLNCSVLCQETFNTELGRKKQSDFTNAAIRLAICGLNKLPGHTGQTCRKNINLEELAKHDYNNNIATSVPLKKIHIVADDGIPDDGDVAFIYLPHEDACKKVSKFVGGNRQLFFFNPEAHTRCTFYGKESDKNVTTARIDVYLEKVEDQPPQTL